MHFKYNCKSLKSIWNIENSTKYLPHWLHCVDAKDYVENFNLYFFYKVQKAQMSFELCLFLKIMGMSGRLVNISFLLFKYKGDVIPLSLRQCPCTTVWHFYLLSRPDEIKIVYVGVAVS